MRIPDPKANTTTEAYLAYKAGYLEESELKPVLYEPYLHFDGWLAYWAGLVPTYPVKEIGKNLLSTKMATSTPREGNPQRDRFVITCEDDRIDWVCNVAEFPTGNGGGIVFEGLKVKKGKTYTLSFTLDSARPMGNIRLANNDSFDSGVQSLYAGDFTTVVGPDLKYTFTANNDWSQLRLYIWSSVAASVSNTGAIINPQLELGSDKTTYETFSGKPEMLCDEEALVAYLSGVTDTYPEEIKDPYDVRIVGYLKYLVSARWGRPEYPVNNEEFYLSTMKPPVVPSGDTPSSDIEMDDTAEAPFIDLKAYGDTSQTTYTGKNLFNVYGVGGTSVGDNLVSYTAENEELTVTQVRANGNGYVWVRLDKDKFLGKELTLSVGEVTSYDGSTGPRIRFTDQNGANIEDVSFTLLPDREPTKTFSVPSELPSGVTELRLYIYVNNSNVAGQVGATSKYTKLQIEVGSSATSYEPYVGGVPAPNPDYPQSVNTVTGRQMVKVEGPNLFYGTNASSGGIVSSWSGSEVTLEGVTTSSYANITGTDPVATLFPAGEYTFSTDTISNDYTKVIRIRENGSNHDYTIPKGGSSVTFTATDSFTIRMCFISSLTTGINISDTFGLQLELGSEPTAYSPYGGANYEINLGKNLFNTTKYSGNITITGLNSFEANRDTARTANMFFSPRLPAGTYTLSYDVSKNSINTYGIACSVYVVNGSGTSGLVSVPQTDGHIEFTFTSPTEVDRLYFYINQNASSGSTASVSNIQIEVGTSATSFASYFEPIELCKIGDYQDYIYRNEDGDWYVHKETDSLSFAVADMNNTESYPGWKGIGKLITQFGGSINEAFARHSSFYTNISGFVEQDSSASTTTGVALNTYGGNNGLIFLYTGKYGLTQTQWKTNYQALIFKIYYGLPNTAHTDTQITNSELIAQLDALMEGGSYEGKTYIKVTATDPNLPGLLYVEAGKYD